MHWQKATKQLYKFCYKKGYVDCKMHKYCRMYLDYRMYKLNNV